MPTDRRATKSELRQEIAELRHVGALMANFCFNVSQSDKIDPGYRQCMKEMQTMWDKIKRRERAD